MTVKQAALWLTDFRTVAACLIAGSVFLWDGVSIASDIKRHSDEVPALKELAQEQRQANALMHQQLMQQQKLLEWLMQERLRNSTIPPELPEQ